MLSCENCGLHSKCPGFDYCPYMGREQAMDSKTLDNTSPELKDGAKVEIFGDTGLWVCICKASCEGEGWMKSTKVMRIKGQGCLVQVSTQQGDHVAEALAFVPGARLKDFEPLKSQKQIIADANGK